MASEKSGILFPKSAFCTAAGRREKGVKEKKGKRQGGSFEEAQRCRVLREALAYVLPAGEAERACDRLLEALGSFDGIFCAPEEVLREIPGVGPEAAKFLRLIIRLSQTYLEERSWNLQRIYDTPSAVEMFRPKFLGRKTEAVCLMLLDGRGRMVYNDIICEGSISEVPLYLRQVLQLCMEYQVEEVFLAHNHPSGVAFPSQNDLLITDRLLVALDSINVVLCDHIIFADESYYFFLGSGVLTRQEDIMRQAQYEETESVRKLESRLRGQQEEG